MYMTSTQVILVPAHSGIKAMAQTSINLNHEPHLWDCVWEMDHPSVTGLLNCLNRISHRHDSSEFFLE